MTNDPIQIEIDSREPREFIHQLRSFFAGKDLATRKPLFNVEIKALPVGDFILNGIIGVERKQADDFISSIVKKDLFRKVEDLVKIYTKERSYLVIEESLIKRAQWSKVHINSIFGALAWCCQHINVLMTLNKEETALALRALALQTVSEEIAKLPRMVITKPKEDEDNVERWQHAVLQTFPRIGVNTSSTILQHYRSPINFFAAICNGDIPPFKLQNREEAAKRWRAILETEVKSNE